LRNGLICPSMLGITIKTQRRDIQSIQQVGIIPRRGYYIVEVIYECEPVPVDVNRALHAGVDIGVNHLAVLTSDKPGFVPRCVNGRPVKSINQFYNKRRAEWQSALDTPWTHPGHSRHESEAGASHDQADTAH
jgi:putative transposase